jgi:hypothetical protein
MKPTKPANMKTVTRSATNIDQKGDRDLASDGMRNGSSQPAKAQGFGGNQQAGKTDPNKTFNFGRGPTVGMTGKIQEGPAKAPTTSVPNFKAAMGANDKLNFGKQERTPGGTRSFEPSGTQNYKGNIDAMNVGRGPTKGNAQGPAK